MGRLQFHIVPLNDRMAAPSEPRGFGQIHAEPVPAPLISPCHLGGRVAEVFLDVALINFGRTREAGAQGVAREEG